MHDKYLRLDYDPEPRVVGVRHGAGQASITDDFLTRNSWFEQLFYHNESQPKDWWKRWINVTNYAKELNDIGLDKKAKHTDFIDFPGLMSGFIVNDKLKAILEDSNLPTHRFLRTTFLQNGVRVEGYWWCCFDVDTGERTVDFAKSRFSLTEQQREAGLSEAINSYEEFENVYNLTGSGATATKLVFTNDFDERLDIWGMPFLALTKAYISQRLLHRLEKERIQGYRAYPSPCDLVFPSDLALSTKRIIHRQIR